MPIPTKNEGESQDDFINRCMGNDVMVSEYPDESQRRAVCQSSWEGKADEDDESFIRFAKGSNTLDVEVFAIGRWNGLDFTKEDLNSMAIAFNSLKEVHKVPLKMGHNNDQPFTDGQPALGWVDDVWVSNDNKLMARFVDVPDLVFNAMKSKLYRHVSVELDMGVEHKGNYYPWVLSGVALLGADIPAVNTLADLQAYMGRGLSYKERVAFTATSVDPEKRRETMSDDNEELQTLKAKLKAMEKEQEKLISQNTTLEQERIKMRADMKSFEENERIRKDNEQRELLKSKLESLVKEKKITPFTRDDFLQDYDQADDKSTIVFAVDKLERTIEANPAYFGVEQARKKAEQERQESELNPDDVVVQRTREYMAKHGEKSFSVAKRQVLQADRELANRYTKMGEG